MTGNLHNRDETEPTAPEHADDQTQKGIRPTGAFARITREIKEEDLSNPAIARLLLDERERLLQEKSDLEPYREGFYTQQRRAEVCEATKAGSGQNMLFRSLVQTLGGALFGAAFSTQGHLFWILFFVGAGLAVIPLFLNGTLPLKEKEI